MIHLLILLFGAHFLCDYPLQGDFLSRGKNRTNPIPGVPWYQCMLAHAFIHATAVYLITGQLKFFAAELVIHFWVDDMKCRGKFGGKFGPAAAFNEDQFYHLITKVMYIGFLIGAL